MNKIHLYIFSFLLLTVFSCKANSNKEDSSSIDTTQITKEESSQIKWMSFEEAIKANETKPKKIFIDFYTSWCGWCKVMDSKTFSDPKVAKLMSEYFYCVKFNAEQKEPLVFQNRTYVFVPQGNKGYHELAAALLNGQMSYPSFIFLTSDYKIITPIAGYVQASEFEPIVSFIGQELYTPEKNINFDDFKANYISK
jgi:thioredoxin-related protein